jgi:cell division septum initiation protein DivIVA
MRGNDPKPASGGTSAASGSGRPSFARARKGWDPEQVGAYLDRVERERDEREAALVAAERRLKEQHVRLEDYEAVEDELTRSVHLARQTGDAIEADAHSRAAEIIAAAEAEAEAIIEDGRRRLAEEERSLDDLRMAVAAEAVMLEEVEQRLSTRISRAAAALVETVDAPGGLGPFSQATATLLEFAQMLQHTARSGTALQVRLEVDDSAAVARVSALDTSPPPLAAELAGAVAAEPAGAVADGTPVTG